MSNLATLLRSGNYAVSHGPKGMYIAAIETVEGGAITITVHKRHADGTYPQVYLPGLPTDRTYTAAELTTQAAALGFTDWQVD